MVDVLDCESGECNARASSSLVVHPKNIAGR